VKAKWTLRSETKKEEAKLKKQEGKKDILRLLCEKKIIMCVYFFALKQNGDSVKLNEKLVKWTNAKKL
jgi:hypothetical protein